MSQMCDQNMRPEISVYAHSNDGIIMIKEGGGLCLRGLQYHI